MTPSFAVRSLAKPLNSFIAPMQGGSHALWRFIMYGCKYLNFTSKSSAGYICLCCIIHELEGLTRASGRIWHAPRQTGQCMKRICEKLGFASLGFSLNGLLEAIRFAKKGTTIAGTGKNKN
ncbi:MAG: hypothetical protein V8Q32_04935 [Anaerotignum faecicola]